MSVLCGAIAAHAEPLLAPEPEPVGWQDGAVIGAGLVAALLSNMSPPRSQVPAPRLGFDEAARNALRMPTSEGRFVARDLSDLTLGISMIAPIVGDGLLNALWYRRNPRAAWRMTVISLEAFAVSAGLQGITHVIVSRERPYVRTCGTDLPKDGYDCHSTQQWRSFYSGHASFSFTGAAVLCWQHVRYRLFGGGAAEAGACAAGFAFAAATAIFRVMGDMHYISDITVGAIMGTAIGFLVPVLHEQIWRDRDVPGSVHISVIPTGTGVSVVGAF